MSDAMVYKALAERSGKLGALREQLERARQEFDSWPDWKREYVCQAFEIATPPRLPAPPREPSDAEVEEALKAWYGRPDWKDVFFPMQAPVKFAMDSMRAALAAAARVRMHGQAPVMKNDDRP